MQTDRNANASSWTGSAVTQGRQKAVFICSWTNLNIPLRCGAAGRESSGHVIVPGQAILIE